MLRAIQCCLLTESVYRRVEEVVASRQTMEGAGVHLRRAFGAHEVPRLDPFLLLDDFRSENPLDYVAGFPWHPHRGIETVTYMLDGFVEHGDSLGNSGVIGPGAVQWMTAGSGIIHQEMPRGREGRMGGLQLWVNLPSSAKMTNPRYQEFSQSRIPESAPTKGIRARVIAGELAATKGPIGDISVKPEYLDLRLDADAVFDHEIPRGKRAFAYVLSGRGAFEPGRETIGSENLVIYEDGDRVQIAASNEGL
ncbi:MAG TPA: pirin family protein, partial [Burkholderiales bacterium]|nr:pirin family protein [Burkholderiales bacterium]